MSNFKKKYLFQINRLQAAYCSVEANVEAVFSNIVQAANC